LWELSPETSWSPDGKTLSFRRHVRGVEFLFVDLDVASGQEHLHLRLPGQDTLPLALSADRRTLFYQRPASEAAASKDIVLVSRDLASGTEHELLRRASMGMRNDMLRLSPDGRLVATVVDPSADKSSVVLVVPSAGGQAREVFRTNTVDGLSVALWARDGESLIVRTPASTEKPLQGGGQLLAALREGQSAPAIRVKPV
jgi:Tol biopolymer transport system component